MKRVLFLMDIDGTMVDLMGCHRRAYEGAIKDVFGIKLSAQKIKENSGKPTIDTIKIPMEELEIFDKKKNKKALRLYINYVKSEINELTAKRSVLIKGVKEFLREAKEKNVVLGVVTGNMKVVGKVILEKSGLISNFDKKFIFYSDNKNSRIEVLKEAKTKAKKFDEIIVFGDTKFDIEAAKENDLKIVYVSETENRNVDLTIKDFSNRNKIFKKFNL